MSFDSKSIEKKIIELEEIAKVIEISACFLFENADAKVYLPEISQIITWTPLNGDLLEKQRTIMRNYQQYYNPSFFLIQNYLMEKEDEFSQLYEKINSYLELKYGYKVFLKEEHIYSFIKTFEKQRSILLSIPSMIEIKEYNLRKIISASYIESDIDEAENLFEAGYLRAAGAIAGVALEKYIRCLCDLKNLEYEQKETMQPLINRLRSKEKIDKDFKKELDYLASIRNKCSHPDEPTEREISHLIDHVKGLNLRL